MYFDIILHYAVQKDRGKKEGDIYIVNIPAPSPLPNDGDDDVDTGDTASVNHEYPTVTGTVVDVVRLLCGCCSLLELHWRSCLLSNSIAGSA